MNKTLLAAEAAALIAQLRDILRELSARAVSLEQEFGARSEAAERKHKVAVHELGLRTAQEKEQAQHNYLAARQSLQDQIKHRGESLIRARQTSNRLRLDYIEAVEGRRKYAVQKGTLDAEKRRDENIARAEAELAQMQGHFGGVYHEFAALEAEARKAFGGYGSFKKLLSDQSLGESQFAEDEHNLLERAQALREQTQKQLSEWNRKLLPKLFRIAPLWVWLALIALVAAIFSPLGSRVGLERLSYQQAGAVAGGAFVLVGFLYFIGKGQGQALASSIAHSLATGRNLYSAGIQKAEQRRVQTIQQVQHETQERINGLNRDWEAAVAEAATQRERLPGILQEKFVRARARHEAISTARTARLEENHAAVVKGIEFDSEERQRTLGEQQNRLLAQFRAEREKGWESIKADWQNKVEPLLAQMQHSSDSAAATFPEWTEEWFAKWAPPSSLLPVVKVGSLTTPLDALLEEGQKLSALPFPVPAQVTLPLLLEFPRHGSLLLESKNRSAPLIGALNNIIFRLLANSPPGRLNFTIIDPIKLGQNFSAITHLADFEDNLINGRIWTQPDLIEERLGELTEHMEKVIQMYLRNEYETIAEYNRQAGNIAEKYHVVVMADFPANLNENAARRLLRIAASGARCGVFTLIHWDKRQGTPPEQLIDELRRNSVTIQEFGDGYVLADPAARPARVLLDPPPDGALATPFLQKIGEIGRGSNRVVVPFEQVAPPPEKLWTLDTGEELRVPIGRSGATKLQYLEIGRGTRQHVLVAGKTGSGKSTLFHTIITNLALWASPEQVEFYLIDFKKGVEFKAYATHRLPHARVVAIESDREFALSVLQRVDDELRLRGDLFRTAGVQDLAGYRRSPGSRPMPRTLLLIDEFQEFFVEEDRVAQTASMLLDRIVRQGRAFGIHVILGSQTLGGAYTLARTTIGQMVIRIALQTNEADAYLIMDENNSAPRLLSRPGEGIYNDMAGALEGNSPFQAVWIDEPERDRQLARVRQKADSSSARHAPLVFEGNAPADVRENSLLRDALATIPNSVPAVSRAWIGAPNSIKGPTEAAFSKRSGNNLLIVGQREETILGMLGITLLSLGAQHPPGGARFFIIENLSPGTREAAFLGKIIQSLPHEVRATPTTPLPELITSVAELLNQEGPSDRPAFLIIHGLQNYKKLRPEDEFSFSTDSGAEGANPASLFNRIFTEGPANGIHVIATVDTFNNVNRFLGRKGLSEFEMRVMFQMSASDSASLADDPRASNLGFHRALFFNEQEGRLETFRPYAMPDFGWLDEAAAQLRARA